MLSDCRLNAAAREQALEDIAILSETVLNDAELSIVGENEDGDIVFEWNPTETVSSQLTVDKNAAGDVSIHFTENGISNTVSFVGDKIFLDGNEVTYSQTMNSEIDIPRPASASFIPYTVYSDTPIYGQSSDYLGRGDNPVRKTNINLGSPWSGLGTSLVSTVIATVLDKNLTGIVGFVNLFLNVAAWAIAEGMKLPGQDAYMSYSYLLYMPSTQPAFQLHTQIKIDFYATSNCSGQKYPQTTYQVYYYG